MKRLFKTILLFAIAGIVISCNKEDISHAGEGIKITEAKAIYRAEVERCSDNTKSESNTYDDLFHDALSIDWESPYSYSGENINAEYMEFPARMSSDIQFHEASDEGDTFFLDNHSTLLINRNTEQNINKAYIMTFVADKAYMEQMDQMELSSLHNNGQIGNFSGLRLCLSLSGSLIGAERYRDGRLRASISAKDFIETPKMYPAFLRLLLGPVKVKCHMRNRIVTKADSTDVSNYLLDPSFCYGDNGGDGSGGGGGGGFSYPYIPGWPSWEYYDDPWDDSENNGGGGGSSGNGNGNGGGYGDSGSYSDSTFVVGPNGEGLKRYNVDWNKLSSSEKAFIREHPYIAFCFYRNAARARVLSEQYYPGTAVGSMQDAFRHAYWSALNAYDYGESLARRFGDAHEDVDNQKEDEREMDLYNNNYGYAVGVSARENGYDKAWIESEVIWAIDNNFLIIEL